MRLCRSIHSLLLGRCPKTKVTYRRQALFRRLVPEGKESTTRRDGDMAAGRQVGRLGTETAAEIPKQEESSLMTSGDF